MRASVRHKQERVASASETWAEEVRIRRGLSKSSLKRRAGDAKGVSVGDIPFTPKYKQDSEAYKRGREVKDTVMELLSKGGRVLGFKVK